MAHPFRIDWSACFLFALGLLVVPIPPLLACILAAAFHELCHMIAVRLIGIPVYSLEITALGCRMETGPMQKKQELICAAAGPAGSLLLAACMSYFPLTGLCAGIQGVYNLLPLYPMDGGRILRAVLALYCTPDQGRKIGRVVGLFCLLPLLGLAFWQFLSSGYNISLLFICFYLIGLLKENGNDV
jgi:stage IV sporulation protein FB